ncbi:MAG: hypothetical protein U0L35_06215 [Methanobrevibacter sp.]|jgi:hypothetical protein|nr:hypothetical protein [Methanobrevibacter sp.]
MLKPVLVIKDTDSTVAIRARIGEDYSEHEIQLSVMLGYYADNDLPVIENLIDLFETVIKRTINDVIPHDNLFLKYDLITDDEISKASDMEIHLIEVKADDVLFRLDGKILALKGFDSDEYSSDEPKVLKRVEKTIPTEKKMSFKEFAKQQRELENKN